MLTPIHTPDPADVLYTWLETETTALGETVRFVCEETPAPTLWGATRYVVRREPLDRGALWREFDAARKGVI